MHSTLVASHVFTVLTTDRSVRPSRSMDAGWLGQAPLVDDWLTAEVI